MPWYQGCLWVRAWLNTPPCGSIGTFAPGPMGYAGRRPNNLYLREAVISIVPAGSTNNISLTVNQRKPFYSPGLDWPTPRLVVNTTFNTFGTFTVWAEGTWSAATVDRMMVCAEVTNKCRPVPWISMITISKPRSPSPESFDRTRRPANSSESHLMGRWPLAAVRSHSDVKLVL